MREPQRPNPTEPKRGLPVWAAALVAVLLVLITILIGLAWYLVATFWSLVAQ